jgi:hypothetical protein
MKRRNKKFMLCAIERIKTQIAGTDENEFGV